MALSSRIGQRLSQKEKIKEFFWKCQMTYTFFWRKTMSHMWRISHIEIGFWFIHISCTLQPVPWYQPWWKWCSDKTTFSCCWGEETEMLAAERLKNEKRSRLSFNFLLQTQRQEQKASSQEEDTEFTRILLNVWCIWNLCVLAKFSWEGGPSLINENWNS